MPDITDVWAYLNGELVRGKDAVIPLSDRGVLWGDAVYDAIRTYNGVPFYLPQRIDRFFRSLYYARIDPGLSKEALTQITDDVLQANLPLLQPDEDLTMNLYVSRGSMAADNGRTPAGTVSVFCRPLAFTSFARFYVQGAPAVIPATRRTPPQCVSPKAKISNKMNHFVAELEAKASNPDAYPIMLDLDGNITESSGANFLFVVDGRLKVPDTRFVLSGADMAAGLDLAAGLGIAADEGTYTTYDVYNAQEAFLTTNSFGILPIVSLNGLPIGTGKVGPMTRRLMAAWTELVDLDFIAQALSHLPAAERAELEQEWDAVQQD
ncbi:MAG: aminotransferase class IV [Planctomycetota bacterium]|jgi:branched-chain amino acid aminotransferase